MANHCWPVGVMYMMCAPVRMRRALMAAVECIRLREVGWRSCRSAAAWVCGMMWRRSQSQSPAYVRISDIRESAMLA